MVSTPFSAQEITVTKLPNIDSNAVGLVSAKNAGLPIDFWSDEPADLIAGLIDKQHFHEIPESRAFLNRMIVAELNPPQDNANGVTAILARVDWLLDNGALDTADAMLTKVGIQHPDIFKRWFDTKLMLGTPDAACEPLRANPALSDDLSTKIYCFAQNQDWFSAELALVSGRNLGALDEETATLLSLFLDPELKDEINPPRIQDASDPLEFTLREALALPRPKSGLPLSQLHVDLDDASGWQAQLRAGENLARIGAIPPQYLEALYASGKASASGGVWERVKAVTRLHAALNGGDPKKTCDALLKAWDQMADIDLTYVFAELFAPSIAAQALPDICLETQINTILLHPNFGALLFDFSEFIPQNSIESAILNGDFSGVETNTQIQAAIKDAYQEDRLVLISPAQSILLAFSDTIEGTQSDPRSVKHLISTLLNAGFTAEAQRLSLQYIVLERST